MNISRGIAKTTGEINATTRGIKTSLSTKTSKRKMGSTGIFRELARVRKQQNTRFPRNDKPMEMVRREPVHRRVLTAERAGGGCVVNVTVTIPHSAATMTVGYSSNIDEEIDEEMFGFGGLRIQLLDSAGATSQMIVDRPGDADWINPSVSCDMHGPFDRHDTASAYASRVCAAVVGVCQPSPAPSVLPSISPLPTLLPTPGDTVTVDVSLQLTAASPPTQKDSDNLQQTFEEKLAPLVLRSWLLTYNVTSSSSSSSSSSRRQRRVLLGNVVWRASFSVVTVMNDDGSDVSDLSQSVTGTLTHSNFTSAVASRVNTTLAVDTSSLAVIEVTRPPSPVPTLMPTAAPTSDPTPLPTPGPTDLIYIDRNIPIAVAKWCVNPVAAESIYGHIAAWGTTEVSDISFLFTSMYCSSSQTFNADISAWDGKRGRHET